MPIMRERRIKFGSIELGIAVEASRAERIRKSLPYRKLIRPALDRMQASEVRGNGREVRQAQAQVAQISEAEASPEAREILKRIAEVEWYHTIEMPHGVVTPGFVDHREQLPFYDLPADMSGMRALDVATYDGYWAFEMERRGAEVVGIDVATLSDIDLPRNWVDEFHEKGLDKPKGLGFQVAKDILGSKARREVLSVYDLSPENLGMFDIVFCSDLLLHLRDPLYAMENIYRVTRQYAIFADVYNPDIEGFADTALSEFTMAGNSDVWWRPNTHCFIRMLKVAHFSHIEEVSRFVLNSRFEGVIHKFVFRAHR